MGFRAMLLLTFQSEQLKQVASYCKQRSENLEWEFYWPSTRFNGLAMGSMKYYHADIKGISKYNPIKIWKINGVRVKIYTFSPYRVAIFAENERIGEVFDNFRIHLEQVSMINYCELKAEEVSFSRIASSFVWKLNHIGKVWIKQHEGDSEVTHEALKAIMEEASVDYLRIYFKSNENEKEYKVKLKYPTIFLLYAECISFDSYFDVESEHVSIRKSEVSNLEMANWVKQWMKGYSRNLQHFEVYSDARNFDLDEVKSHLEQGTFRDLPNEKVILFTRADGKTGMLQSYRRLQMKFKTMET